VSRVIVSDGIPERELLALAAAVEQGSGHLLARSVVRAATDARVAVARAEHVTEDAGHGVTGLVEGRRVCVGARSYADACVRASGHRLAPAEADLPGLRAHIVVDGRERGVIEFADRVRPGLAEFFADLERLGVRRILLLSGDSAPHTMGVAAEVGIREARGELTPADKAAEVQRLEGEGERVLMIGDGTNDAPALSAAHVGIALASRGGGIAAEAADVVLLADDVRPVADVIRIARRTLRVARQSIRIGLGLSVLAMLAAAAGFIPPITGALLQEAIDVAVIVNALRTSR
jgi:P-type E1-E2 ATPase